MADGRLICVFYAGSQDTSRCLTITSRKEVGYGRAASLLTKVELGRPLRHCLMARMTTVIRRSCSSRMVVWSATSSHSSPSPKQSRLGPDWELGWSPVTTAARPGTLSRNRLPRTTTVRAPLPAPRAGRHDRDGTPTAINQPALQPDEGQTWSENVVVDKVGGAYPSMVTLKDESILIVYYEEGDRSSIRARRFRATPAGIEWLPLDPDSSL